MGTPTICLERATCGACTPLGKRAQRQELAGRGSLGDLDLLGQVGLVHGVALDMEDGQILHLGPLPYGAHHRPPVHPVKQHHLQNTPPLMGRATVDCCCCSDLLCDHSSQAMRTHCRLSSLFSSLAQLPGGTVDMVMPRLQRTWRCCQTVINAHKPYQRVAARFKRQLPGCLHS